MFKIVLLDWCLRSSRSNNNIDPVYNLVRNLLAERREEEMTHRRESRKTPRSPYLWWWWWWWGGSDQPPPFRCWWCIERRYLGILVLITPVDGLLLRAGGCNHLLLIISPLPHQSSGKHPVLSFRPSDLPTRLFPTARLFSLPTV